MMTYFKSLLFNFLCVFFVDHVIPGIEISSHTKIPEIKGDIIFSACLGFIFSLIFPFLRYLNCHPSYFKIGLLSFIISFGAYGTVNFLPLGIEVTTLTAYFWASLLVWFGAYLTNHLEFKKYLISQEIEQLKTEQKKTKHGR